MVNRPSHVVRAALLGYGMFGSDVVVRSLWDMVRNGIAPYLDRIGLDDRAAGYQDSTFRLVAIGTRSEGSARRAQRETMQATGDQPQVFWGERPWIDVFDAFPDLDLVIVATPDHLHTAPILFALERGAHVLTEKPLCLDLREADAMIALARDRGLVLGVDMHKRYDPDHLKIFRELAPRLGTPLYARGVLEEPLEVSTSTFKWAEQSDPFSYVGIHWVDLFMHELDLTPMSLYAIGQKQRLLLEHHIDAFDSVEVMVTHTNGSTIVYETNWLTPADFEGPVNQESHLVGSRGKVESDSQYRGLRYWFEDGGSRTANTHFFRQVQRPGGSLAAVGYGKDSIVDCIEKVFRHKVHGASVASMAGAYPDAESVRLPTAVVQAARAVVSANYEHVKRGEPPVVTASFGPEGIRVFDPYANSSTLIYDRAI